MRDAADRRAGGYSTGMRQRLGLAATLLGDPEVLVLDEPANGLDPQGIRWLRDFLRGAAAEGRTVLVSSHVLSEVEQTVDDVLVIHRGRLVKSGPIASLMTAPGVRVRSPRAAELAAALEATGPRSARGELLVVQGARPTRSATLAFAIGAPAARARRGGRLAGGGLLPPDQRRGRERAVVSRLVRGELIKLRTTRTALGLHRGGVLLTLADRPHHDPRRRPDRRSPTSAARWRSAAASRRCSWSSASSAPAPSTATARSRRAAGRARAAGACSPRASSPTGSPG